MSNIFFWPEPGMPTLGYHIAHIVLMRAEEKMSRIAAWGIVAPMQDKHPIRDGAVSDCPRRPVGQDGPALRTPKANTPVPIIELAAHPWPALVRTSALINSGQDAI